MADRVDAMEHAHEPPHRHSAIEPVLVRAELTKLGHRDHSFLPSREPHNPLIDATWAGLFAHTAN
jgi:hypothetical protein